MPAKPTFALPAFPFSVDKLDDVKLPEQIQKLAELFASGKQFKDDLETALFPPMELSGTASLSGQTGSASYLVNGSAEAKLQVSAFNDPADRDPDGVISHSTGKAWLKQEIGAALKGNIKGSLSGDAELAFGLEAGLGARLIQYRAHAPAEGVGPALVSDLASFRFAVRREDVEALGADDAVAFLAGARLAFNATLTWADAFTATIAALDQALGVAGVSAFSVQAGASLAFNLAVSDDFRLIFRPGESAGTTRIEVHKVHASRVGVTGGLQVKAQLANPEKLSQALEAYLVARLGVPIKKIQALEEKIGSALALEQLPEDLRPLALQIAGRLGLADLQTQFGELKSRLAKLQERLREKLLAALKTRVELAFQLAYTRVSNDESVLVCELERAALAKHHGQLLLGNLSGVLAALSAGQSGYKLVEYLKTRTIDSKLSFGFTLSLGKWAGRDLTVKEKRWEIQTNLSNHERVSFDGRKTNSRKWGEFEVENSFDLSASMNDFSAAATADASEFQYGLSMAWQWNAKLTPALLEEAFDLANLWGAFDESRNEALAAEVRAKLGGKVQIDVQLDLADSAFRFFFDLPDAEAGGDLEAAWADALAIGLPRVVVAKDAFRQGVGRRRAVYGAAAQFVLSQDGGFDITAAIGRVRYEAAGLSGHALETLRRIDSGDSGFPPAAAAFPQSLRALWTQDASGSRPRGRFQRASQAIFRFEQAVRSGGDKKVIQETFERIQELLSMPYYYRVLGTVFANLAARGGQNDHTTASLRITDKDGNVMLMG